MVEGRLENSYEIPYLVLALLSSIKDKNSSFTHIRSQTRKGLKMPVIEELTDTDFYKLTMGQFVFHRHPNVPVAYRLKNRTREACIADVVPERALRDELEHVRMLRFSEEEIAFLRSQGIFGEDFLLFLKGFTLPDFHLETQDGQFVLEFRGRWAETVYWETLALSIVNELYCRYRNAEASREDMRRAKGLAHERLKTKIRSVSSLEHARIIEFGTRRRFSREWQRHVTEYMKAELNGLFAGTSNVALARRLGLKPIGTMAHELFMAYPRLGEDTDEEICAAHNRVLVDWWDEYGEPLSIALTDTYGTEFFFGDMTAEQATQWKGLRQDSGDPVKFGERTLKFYRSHGIDPRKKVIVWSDGLDETAVRTLAERFRGQIGTAFGWGTNLTNDVNVPPISLVVKLEEANGRRTVKLSDNLAKATGSPEDVKRFKRVFGYAGANYERTRY